MHTVTVLALEGAVATSITGPMDVFSFTGVLWNTLAGEEATPCFVVEVVTPRGKPVRCLNGFPITPGCPMAEVRHSDLIIIPSVFALRATGRDHEAVLAWLHGLYARGAQIAGLCAGAFLLAQTGLLDDRVATTHWGLVEKFRQLFPRVLLRPERLLTDAGDLYCSGALHSCLDLSLYLVGKFVGPGLVEKCAKTLGQDMARLALAPFSFQTLQGTHNDAAIKKAQRLLEQQFAHGLHVEALARNIGMGRRTFERRFKAATGDTPLSYLQRVRVEVAKSMLETGHKSFDEITTSVGYEDSNFFRMIFVKHTGCRPSEYRSHLSRAVWMRGNANAGLAAKITG